MEVEPFPHGPPAVMRPLGGGRAPTGGSPRWRWPSWKGSPPAVPCPSGGDRALPADAVARLQDPSFHGRIRFDESPYDTARARSRRGSSREGWGGRGPSGPRCARSHRCAASHLQRSRTRRRLTGWGKRTKPGPTLTSANWVANRYRLIRSRQERRREGGLRPAATFMDCQRDRWKSGVRLRDHLTMADDRAMLAGVVEEERMLASSWRARCLWARDVS